jgi:hypothetical protein
VYLEAALEEAEKQFVQENKGDVKQQHALGRKVQGEGALTSFDAQADALSFASNVMTLMVCCGAG